MTTILDSDGRIQLPSEIQSQLDLKPGDKVILEIQVGQCLIRPERALGGLRREGNVLVHHGVSNTSCDAVVHQIREERLSELGEDISG